MRRRSGCRFAFVVLALVCAAPPARGKDRPRISIAGIRGDADGAVAAQLASALCDANECVPGARVRRGGRLDFAAVKAERVDGVVFGTVAVTRRSARLELALLRTSLRPERTWALPLDGSKRIAAGALGGLALDLQRVLSGSAPAAPSRAAPRPAAPPVRGGPGLTSSAPRRLPDAPRGPSAGATPAPRPTPAPERPAHAAGPGAPTPRPEPQERAPRTNVAAPGRARPSLGSFDLGVDVVQRRLAYDGVGAGATLQKYAANAIVAPAARVELYPLALATDGWPADLAVFGEYARSVGFETGQAGTAGGRHDSVYSLLDVGAGWRFRPVASSPATVLARVSYRALSLAVKPAGGALIAGLPDADLAGPSVGLELAAPLSGRFGLLLGAAYTRWTRAKDLVAGDVAFFPDGSAYALDAEAGLSVELPGAVSLRVVGEYARTRYSLRGTSAYAATGATDRYVGGRTTLRLRF